MEYLRDHGEGTRHHGRAQWKQVKTAELRNGMFDESWIAL